jgi:hypothetical protein
MDRGRLSVGTGQQGDGNMSKYWWIKRGGDEVYNVGILADGTLHNPRGYPDALVRALVLAADDAARYAHTTSYNPGHENGGKRGPATFGVGKPERTLKCEFGNSANLSWHDGAICKLCRKYVRGMFTNFSLHKFSNYINNIYIIYIYMFTVY